MTNTNIASAFVAGLTVASAVSSLGQEVRMVSDFNQAPPNDYRPGDLVALRAWWPVEWIGLPATGEIVENTLEVPIDTRRRKHLEAGAPDYHVHETLGAEWLNYTRQFEPGLYRVYLRASSREAQELILQEVVSNPSPPGQTAQDLGVFKMPNTMGHRNHRYIPLTGQDGHEINLALGGEQTLRLLMGGEFQEFKTGSRRASPFI